MKHHYFIILACLLFFNRWIHAQEWSLRLRSSVELRTFKLTNKADISQEKLAGAAITLYKGSTIVNQMQSDANGDFVIDVPPNGEFILAVTYQGCNAKKFIISTMGVPEELGKDNYKPTFGIEGVIMARAFPTIDYSVLKQPLVRVVYVSNGKKFDDEESYTNQILTELSKIRDSENDLIERFTSTNNIGDIALSKGDCPLAKASYEKAMTIIPGESYPGDQLVKVGDCLKNKELADKKAAEEAAAKLAAEKAAQEKAAADKLAKEQEAAKKLEEQRLAKEKQAAEKAAADKLQQEKAAAEKLAKEQNAAKKAEQEKLNKEKLAADKKPAADKLSKEKPANEQEAKDKEASDKKQTSQAGKEKPTPAIKTKSDDAKKISVPVDAGNGLSSSNSSSGTESNAVNSGSAKYSTPQALGSDKYKSTIKRADELFKMKRYAEAKPVYEEALKQKINDAYAMAKLAEIEKLMKK